MDNDLSKISGIALFPEEKGKEILVSTSVLGPVQILGTANVNSDGEKGYAVIYSFCGNKKLVKCNKETVNFVTKLFDLIRSIEEDVEIEWIEN